MKSRQSFIYNSILVLILTVFTSCVDSKQKAFDLKQEGTALLYKTQYKEAIEKFEQALEYNDKDAETWYYIGNAWFGLKDENKAFENFSKAIEVDPNYALSYVNRGKIYKERKDNENACKDWKKAESLGIKTLKEETKFCQ